MKLDSRIKDRNHIFDCFGVDEAEKYIGKECYMTNSLADFWNLESIRPRTLTEIQVKDNGRYVRYVCNYNCEFTYTYCLPVELVTPKNEKTYRPYTIEEFQKIFTIGQHIKFRFAGINTEKTLLLIGYEVYYQEDNNSETYILIGYETFKLDELFEEYEWQEPNSNAWKPFGVEE